MTALRANGRILRAAIRAGYEDFKTIHTVWTWLFAWFVRLLAQVSFFGLVGRLLGSKEAVSFLLVGNAVLLAAAGSLFTVASTAWERWSGTLPLLVASPSRPVGVYLGRSAFWVGDAIVSSLGTFFLATLIFSYDLPWPRVLLVVPVVVLISVSAYFLGTFLGGLVLGRTGLRNVVSNLAWLTLASVCGVNVPRSYEPAPVRWFADALPLTHGLSAIRSILAGRGAASVALSVAAEAIVALGWLAASLALFDRLAEHGRRDGSIEFGA